MIEYNIPFIHVIPPTGITFTELSRTVPNQDISVKEIYYRYVQGNLPDIAFPKSSGDDESFDSCFNIGTDIFEATENVRNFESSLKEQKLALEEAERSKRERDEYQRLKAKFESLENAENNKSASSDAD